MAPRKGEKDQHIQVSVRCRPLNSIEKRQSSYSVVETIPEKREVVVKEKIGVNPHTKTFSFDHVFSAHTPQIDVYRGIVTPIIEEVLMGYNCTVFAYGQTGTGKTFTMEGERTEDMDISWEEDPLAGIIPRAMHNVFERLQSSEMEYSVRVSFLELYNEELFDLLGSGDDSLRLKIYEDGTKKGSVVIQGLEEVTVHNKDDVYAILERGSAKRQTASTLMNAASSRSHTVFSAIIHTKENSIEGEELLKTGKLNLVDLAGSENIGRSGAVDKRAREAGNINQSLLTLGRVITSLVEHAPHIPYRESKLTRLLQDSLGGKTKTSIIATISPASVNLEETLSTLDYAHRAKNIQNKPEINQKLTKKALLKEYTGEIERLKKDLQAAREKNGIFIAEENYTAMQVTMAQQSDSIKELEERILVMTEEMVKINELFTETKDDLLNTRNELDSTTKTLEQTTTTLTETQNDLEETRTDRDEQRHLVIKHVDTETSLFSEANQLLQTADESTADVGGLHDKLDRKRKVESHNDQCQGQFRETFSQDVTRIKDGVDRFNSSQNSAIATARQQLGALVASRKAEMDTLLSDLTTLSGSVGEKLTEVESHLSQTNQLHTADIQAVSKSANSTKETVCDSVSGFEREVFGRLVSAMEGILTATQLTLHEFGGQIDTQLSAIEAREKSYIEELRRDMKSLSTSVEGYVSRTESLLADMTTQRECAQRKDQELDSLLIELIQQKRSHFSAYCQQGEQLSESLRENLSCVSAVKKETERCEVAAEKHQSEFMSQASEHRGSMHGFVKKIGESLTQCGETRKELVTETVTFRDKCHKTLSDGTDRLCDQLTRHNTHIITQQNIVCQKTQAIQHYVGDTVTQLSSVATEGQDQVTQKVGQLDGQCKAMVEEQMSFCERTTGDVQSLGRSLETFLTQQLQKDIPTGLTPQRRDFTYPQQLTSTEPHDLLLARFRAQRQKDQVAVTLFTADDSADSAPEAEETSPDPTPVIEETSADPQRLSPTELSDKLCLPDLSDNVSEAGSDISTRSGRSGMSSKENRSRVPRSRISKLAKPSQRTPVNGPQTRRPLRTTNTPQN